MKRIISFLLIGFFALNLVQAQNEEEIKQENKKAPEITFEKTTHDYGTVKKGGNGECEFVFTNTGKEPLILSNVRSSCGCTVPSWPKEPIKKKKSGVIKVKYNTNRMGVINKSITVYSNANNSPIRLKISGKVILDDSASKQTNLTPYKEKEKVSAVPRVDKE